MQLTRRQFLSRTSIGAVALPEVGSAKGPVIVTPATLFALQRDTNLQEAFQRIDQFIREHMRQFGLPGMIVTLARRDRILRASTYGFADVKTRATVTPVTLF